MQRLRRMTLVMTACALALAGCQTDGSDHVVEEGSPCVDACEVTYERCSMACSETDDTMCAEECSYKMDKCKNQCS